MCGSSGGSVGGGAVSPVELMGMEVYKAEHLASIGYRLGKTSMRTQFIDSFPSMSQRAANFATKETAHSLAEQLREQGVTVNLAAEMQLHGVAERIADRLVEEARRGNSEILDEAIQSVGHLRLSPRWTAKLGRLKESIDSSDAKTLAVRLSDLFYDLIEELKEPLFLYVPYERRRYFDQTEPPFGQV